MKIAATISAYHQVSQSQYRDVNTTKVFDDTTSIKEIINWAKSIDDRLTFHSILLSEVVDE